MKWIMKDPKPGDMIRVGLGSIYHFGIFVSDEEVIQFGLAPDARNLLPDSEVAVLASDIDTFLAGGFLEVCEFDRKERKGHRKPKEVIACARSRLGERGYHILYNNCEHFANECLSGQHICEQADSIRALFRNLPVVDVYLAALPAEGEMPPLDCALRQQDIDRVTAPLLRRQKYHVWRLLEYALQRSFGLKSGDLTFRKEGERYFCEQAYFSLSHSGNALAVAVSRAAVGVDVEQVTSRDTERLTRRVFNDAEAAIYAALPEAEKAAFFFRVWTAKEALFKAENKAVFIPTEQDSRQGNVKTYEKTIGGEPFYLSVATKTTERIRLYENVLL